MHEKNVTEFLYEQAGVYRNIGEAEVAKGWVCDFVGWLASDAGPYETTANIDASMTKRLARELDLYNAPQNESGYD